MYYIGINNLKDVASALNNKLKSSFHLIRTVICLRMQLWYSFVGLVVGNDRFLLLPLGFSSHGLRSSCLFICQFRDDYTREVVPRSSCSFLFTIFIYRVLNTLIWFIIVPRIYYLQGSWAEFFLFSKFFFPIVNNSTIVLLYS